MGLLDQIVGGVSGLGGMGSGMGGMLGGNGGGMFGAGGSMFGGGVKSILAGGLLSMIASKALGGGSGLGGLLDRFRNNGMGQQADSWVNHGQNQPVTPQQVEQALGPQIHDLAQQAGIPKEQAAGYLSELIPQVVDKLTPEGTEPDHGTISSALGKLLGH